MFIMIAFQLLAMTAAAAAAGASHYPFPAIFKPTLEPSDHYSVAWARHHYRDWTVIGLALWSAIHAHGFMGPNILNIFA